MGIFFSNDLKLANEYNWQECLKKMGNQIKLLLKRTRSLKGKAIILNSIILSKTQFLSNIFPIPKTLENQIHKLMFQYIWHYKKMEPISRTTLHLPKEEGGIGILHLNIHNKALRIKHLMNLEKFRKSR